MTAVEQARAYIEAWNAHDTDRINATFAEGGTYSDPNVPDGVSGPALAGYVNGLVSAFPDLLRYRQSLRSRPGYSRGRMGHEGQQYRLSHGVAAN